MRFPKQRSKNISDDHYSVYSDYSKTLRAWFVAYGVGGPALIISQKEIWSKLVSSKNIDIIVILFMFGVGLQVLIALLNKSIMWVSYYGEHKPTFKIHFCYRFVTALARFYWIDLIVDLLTTSVFIYATYLCFQSLYK